jgi:hypothetical protein
MWLDMWKGATRQPARGHPPPGVRDRDATGGLRAGYSPGPMSVKVETGATLSFDQFWRWLKQHASCILRAGTVDTYLYDQEAYHWHLAEDSDRNPNVQLVWGKLLVGEMVLDTRDLLFVEATPDPEGSEPGQFLFELIGGSKEEPYPVYHFLLAHGFEEEAGHPARLKH